MNKPHWQIMHDSAQLIKDPAEREKWLEYAEKEKQEYTKKSQEIIGISLLSKVFDIVSIILLLLFILIVIYFFKKSVFEGFISGIVSFFFIKYLFKNRSNDFFSWFFGWF